MWQLGLFQIAAFALYKLLIKLGFYSKKSLQVKSNAPVRPYTFPQKTNLKNWSKKKEFLEIPNRIMKGEFLSFGMIWARLDFQDADIQQHWSKAKLPIDVPDIKLLWEPARFDWCIPLTKAYYLTENEDYYFTFRETTLEFITKNPVGQGLNWQSAQEVAIRFINLSIAYSLFAAALSTDKAFDSELRQYMAAMPDRISQTLIYAYAQNNNHLLSEAVGLLTASVFFSKDEIAKKYQREGIYLLNYCLKKQFYENGAYIQLSTNYHRLVLDLLIWVGFLEGQSGEKFIKNENCPTIHRAIDWLYKNADSHTGKMNNYGHNDGAYLLQFANVDYDDARPTIQAASRAFGLADYFSAGDHDEKAAWLGFSNEVKNAEIAETAQVARLQCDKSWVILRATQHENRPAHADQLHLDLWYKGQSIVHDNGTFSYNRPAPWRNQLSRTRYHNSIVVNDRDQMIKCGTFRWQNWSSGNWERWEQHLKCEHDGYRDLGIIHQREVLCNKDEKWCVKDRLNFLRSITAPTEIELVWHLKDGVITIDDTNSVYVEYDGFKLVLCFNIDMNLSVFRAGKCILGKGVDDETLGWFSATYNLKTPSLTIIGKKHITESIELHSNFDFLNC